MKRMNKIKSGVTSIYVVVFTTLLIGVIIVGFVSLILSESSQTVETKLSQSSYDSALAGVEDAKLAIIAYHNCVGQNTEGQLNGQAVSCANIKKYMTEYGDNCNAAAWILGRQKGPLDGGSTEGGEVLIQETESGTTASEETTQAYTCVTIGEVLSDFRSYLNADSPTRIVPLRTEDISKISGIRISWYSDNYNTDRYIFSNVNEEGSISFQSVYSSDDGAAAPPTISVQLLQTDSTFEMVDFDKTTGSQTNRGLLYLVPSDSANASIKDGTPLAATALLNSNNHSTANQGYTVYCPEDSDAEFACSASIQLPLPIQKYDEDDPGNLIKRSSDNSFLIISLPYGQPTTDFAVELCIDKNGDCELASDDTGLTKATADFDGAQARVDSTGRANDIYSRVDARVELADIYFPFSDYALQLSDSDTSVDKSFWVTYSSCWYTDNKGKQSNSCQTAGSAL